MLIDIHAHVQFNAFKDDADEVIKRAKDAGVKMVAPSSQESTARRGIEYAEKYPEDIWAATGLHPIHLKPACLDPSEGEGPEFQTRGERFQEETWREFAKHPKVVGLGEVGLDYIERLEITKEDRKLQEDVYRKQIELALEVKKPIIQHCRSGKVDGKKRSAHEDALRIVEEYVPKGLTGVAHCFSGNLAQARRYIELGFYLSFTGLITYVDQWDELIREIPLERICVETDIPYMTPVPHRGERNEPQYVRYVAEHIAKLKGVSFDAVAAQTTQNAKTLFSLPIS